MKRPRAPAVTLDIAEVIIDVMSGDQGWRTDVRARYTAYLLASAARTERRGNTTTLREQAAALADGGSFDETAAEISMRIAPVGI